MASRPRATIAAGEERTRPDTERSQPMESMEDDFAQRWLSEPVQWSCSKHSALPPITPLPRGLAILLQSTGGSVGHAETVPEPGQSPVPRSFGRTVDRTSQASAPRYSP